MNYIKVHKFDLPSYCWPSSIKTWSPWSQSRSKWSAKWWGSSAALLGKVAIEELTLVRGKGTPPSELVVVGDEARAKGLYTTNSRDMDSDISWSVPEVGVTGGETRKDEYVIPRASFFLHLDECWLVESVLLEGASEAFDVLLRRGVILGSGVGSGSTSSWFAEFSVDIWLNT